MSHLASHDFAHGLVRASGFADTAVQERARLLAAAHELLLKADLKPARVDFSGCTNKAEADWCRMGGSIAELRALASGTAREAEVALTAMNKRLG